MWIIYFNPKSKIANPKSLWLPVIRLLLAVLT
jgi:hypothetical protein